MREMVLIGLFLLTLSDAGVFTKPVVFRHADPALDRKYPTQKEYLLSYNNVLEDVRSSVVNISTKKSVRLGGGYANPFWDDPFFREFFRGYEVSLG